jgi:hypothetical protein
VTKSAPAWASPFCDGDCLGKGHLGSQRLRLFPEFVHELDALDVQQAGVIIYLVRLVRLAARLLADDQRLQAETGRVYRCRAAAGPIPMTMASYAPINTTNLALWNYLIRLLKNLFSIIWFI